MKALLASRVGAVLLLLALTCWPGAPVQAAGVLLSPAAISWPQALAGADYTQVLYLAAPADAGRIYGVAFEAGGAEGRWISFATADLAPTSRATLALEAGATLAVQVHVAVPATAALGTYAGRITVADATPPAASATPAAGPAVSLQASVPVTVTVVGVRTVSGVVSSIRTDEVAEAGSDFHVLVRFRNTGTVEASPDVAVDVSSGGVLARSGALDGRPVPAQAEALLTVTIDTTGLEPGAYAAQTIVSLEGRQVALSVLPFSLASAGSLPRGGRLLEAPLGGDPAPGSVARLGATFENTGLVGLAASLQADVYQGGALVESVQSTPVAVGAGQSALLTLYYRAPRPGSYEARLRVDYGAGTTAELRQSFAAGPPGSDAPALGPAGQGHGTIGAALQSARGWLAGVSLLPFAGGLLAAAALAASAVLARRRLPLRAPREGRR